MNVGDRIRFKAGYRAGQTGTVESVKLIAGIPWYGIALDGQNYSYGVQGDESIEKIKTGKEITEEFDEVRNMAELRALSNYSLESPLTESQFERMKELGKKCGLKN